MRYCLILLLFLSGWVNAQLKMKYQKNESFTYEETVKHYQELSEKYKAVTKFEVIGQSDIGQPIYLFTISMDSDFDPASNKAKSKAVILINNAIHPGEPCGVDASAKLAEDLLSGRNNKKFLKRTVLCIIPFYNVGGGLNRSCCSRANQNGPLEYGFRGNSQNRDLNRDFIKCDTRNAKAFVNAFQQWKPDYFVDTHTTNGSDHQYTMTLIATQPDKLGGPLSNLLQKQLVPDLYKKMKKDKMEMIPYVYSLGSTPDTGIKDYLETPRYSTGYSTLFGALGFVTEALKYKSYPQRVEQTYAFLLHSVKWVHKNRNLLLTAKKSQLSECYQQDSMVLNWELDTSSYTMIDFKGYEQTMVDSKFGKDAKRLVYQHDQPYTKSIRYYNRYKSTTKVKKPLGYVIPQAYAMVIERLKMNGIEMTRLESDTTMAVDMYFIEDYKTVKNPYEGHYLHYNVKVKTEYMPVKFYKGDYVAYTQQEGIRYLIETLEPQAADSFFAWNFFDGILQQKEWFSSFAFEPLAEKLLEEDKYLKAAFDQKKKEDPDFAKSHSAQLYFIYTQSPYYENTHNRYPVARLVD